MQRCALRAIKHLTNKFLVPRYSQYYFTFVNRIFTYSFKNKCEINLLYVVIIIIKKDCEMSTESSYRYKYLNIYI